MSVDLSDPWYVKARNAVRDSLPDRFRSDLPLVPVVRLSGVIGFSTPLKPGLSLSSVAKPLERAFAMKRAKAVALLINSPGGSPVQSHLIYRRIRQLSEEKGLPVLAFIEDVGASGGYMIACAADEIICDPSSMVGSVGVVGGTFGFVKLIDKIGVERRLYTSGDRKAMLDPFLPEKPEDVQRVHNLQQEIHTQFIALVKGRRAARLQRDDQYLFSGEYWTGATAVELGIADSLGDIRAVLRERYGESVRMPVMTPERSFLAKRLGGTSLGTDVLSHNFAEDLVSALEARAIWSRYGL